MFPITLFFCSIVIPSLAAAQQSTPDTPILRTTSTLVFLDVTVLDKKDKPVVKGLTQQDFAITESNRPQRIFSFEAPEAHVLQSRAANDNPDGKAPVTILVVDLLNSKFEDSAYIRYKVQQFLEAQPKQLDAPTELMMVGNQSLELLQGYTRSREDLLFALKHMPSALPYETMPGASFMGRFLQSIAALQEIALQNRGVPGRKNIIWVGRGGPPLETTEMVESLVKKLERFVHDTTNELVDARMSLFLVYPGLDVRGGTFTQSEAKAEANIGNGDPFAGDINFGSFVKETGGTLFHNRNDLDALISRSQQMGSEYYTLTYQPQGGNEDGRFRRIRVTLRDPNLHVVTKAGYFAPDAKAPVDPQQQTEINLAQATRSTIPFDELDVKIGQIVQHPDTRTADITVLVRSKNLQWQPIEDGKSNVNLYMSAASLASDRTIVASKIEKVTIFAISQDRAALATQVIHLKVSLRVPKNAKTVRVAVETDEQGRIGAVDLDRKVIDAAPSAPTPLPKITPRPTGPTPPPGT
jgi:VWFA-related protein